MTITRSALLAFVLGLALTARAGAPSPTSAVLQANQARQQAMMAGDATVLGKLLSDTLLFVHPDGRIESKTDYVKNMLAGDTEHL